MFRLLVFGRDGKVCGFSKPAGLVDVSIAAHNCAMRGYPHEIVVNTRARQREYEEFVRANVVAFNCPTCGKLTLGGKHPPDAECQGK